MVTERQEIGMKNEKSWSRRILELEIVSPIHIGTREGKITALEYFYHQGRVFLIDEDKFGKYLNQRKMIDLFVREAAQGPLIMERFLRNTARIDPASALPQITSRSIPGGEPAMQDFRPFIRDGLGRIFLPGTSLKGVFRTAVLYRMVKNDQGLNKELIAKAESGLQGLSEWKKKRYSEIWLQKDLLQNYSLPLPNLRKGPNTDILRCLTLRDAYPCTPVKTGIVPIRFLSKRANGEFYWSQRKGDRPSGGKDLGVWIEAVIEGKFSMEIGWDQALFEKFRNANNKRLAVSGIEDLLIAAREMTKDLCTHEKEFFKRKTKLPPGTTVRDLLRVNGFSLSDAEGAAGMLASWYGRNDGELFRIGFGSGMLSTTVNLALPAELRGKIRDACGLRRPGDPAPKSRRVWRKSDHEILPMGWMKII